MSCCEIYLVKLLLGGEAQAVHRVSPAVCPLTELLGRLSEGHVGCNGAVDDSLKRQSTSSEFSPVTYTCEVLQYSQIGRKKQGWVVCPASCLWRNQSAI